MYYLPLFNNWFWLFFINIKKIIRNVNLGIDVDRKDNQVKDGKNMAMIALRAIKMVKRPVGIMHIIVYVGFIIINIELLDYNWVLHINFCISRLLTMFLLLLLKY
jgi:hypothetical protein